VLVQNGHAYADVIEYPFSFFTTALKSVARSKIADIKGFAFSISLLLDKEGNKTLDKLEKQIDGG